MRYALVSKAQMARELVELGVGKSFNTLRKLDAETLAGMLEQTKRLAQHDPYAEVLICDRCGAPHTEDETVCPAQYPLATLAPALPLVPETYGMIVVHAAKPIRVPARRWYQWVALALTPLAMVKAIIG